MSFFYIGDDADASDERVEHRDDVAVLIVGGEIDYAASPQLKRRINEHIDAGARGLVLDLSTATFIDSTAIGVLVGAVMKLHELGGGALAVVCTDDNKRVQQIFEIAGVDSLIELHDSREQAVSALALAG